MTQLRVAEISISDFVMNIGVYGLPTPKTKVSPTRREYSDHVTAQNLQPDRSMYSAVLFVNAPS